MKISDEEIDQIFREARQPETPAYSEGFWNEMEKMLPTENRRKKALIWWFAAAAGLIGITTLIAWGFLHPEKQVSGAPVITAATQPAAAENTNNGNPSNRATMTPDAVENNDSETGAIASSQKTASGSGGSAGQTRGNGLGANRVGQPGPLENEPVDDRLIGEEKSVATDVTETALQDDKPVLLTTFLPFRMPRFMDDSKELVSYPALPETPKEKRYYVQVSAGAGQSPQRSVSNQSDFLHYYVLGGGLFKQLDQMVLTFGAQARVDFTNNIILAGQSPVNPMYTSETRHNQLYSIETPVSMGFCFGKNTFALVVTPGFQTNFSGKHIEYDQQHTEVRSEKVAGKVMYARTLTFETGVSYQRSLSRDWYLGLAVNIDAIRPFYSNYEGVQRTLPLNGQVFVRKTF